MDLQEWELLHELGFVNDDDDDAAENLVYSPFSSGVDMNYFICPPKAVQKITPPVDRRRPLTSPTVQTDDMETKTAVAAVRQDPISQVFFKKMKESEVKVESGVSRGVLFDDKEEGTNINRLDESVAQESESEEGMKMWKRIGGICSFGVVAAIISLSSSSQRRTNHKLRFQIYANDKRRKQERSKVNEAIWGMRGVSTTRAHITLGGFYDASSC